jgi:hypothetical protein
MTDIYVVLIKDRHADPDVVPYAREKDAVARAEKDAAGLMRHPEDPGVGIQELTEGMKKDGWVWYCNCSCEDDSVRVLRRELQEAPA